MKIFNRWGKIMLHQDPDIGWNGEDAVALFQSVNMCGQFNTQMIPARKFRKGGDFAGVK
jgi:hypothetical protein